MPSFLSIKTCIVVCVLSAITFTCGCGENPQRAADKKAKAAVDAAINAYASTGDFDKAQKALKQALAGAGGETAGQEVVALMNGSLNYGKAVKMQAELTPLWASINSSCDELSWIVSQVTQTQLEKAEIEASLRSRQEERRQLGVQLEGDANTPSLTAELKDAQAKLTDLKSKQSELSQKLSEKLKQATELQRQADELLAKAELSQGDTKATLQKQAYDLLLGSGGTDGKNAYLKEAQELQDQLSTTESEIALVEPKAATFAAKSETIQKRIDELDKSDFNTKSNERLTAIGSALARFQEEFSAVLGQIEQTQSQLALKMKEITELISSAQKDFKKITKEESLRDFARVAGGEALFWEGRMGGDYALLQRHLAARLTILASGEATDSEAQLKTLAQRYLDDSDEFVAKAIADYNDASDLYGKISVKKDDFTAAVLKNRILVLAQKAYLAERIENMDAKDQAVEQAKDLIDKAVKLDPSFDASLSEPPYNILTGRTAPKPSAATEEAPAEANAVEPNQPVAEPNELTAEPNQPATEPNEQAAEANQPADEQSMKEKAEQVVNLMSEGKFEEATASFDDNMKQALPAAKLADVWKQLETAGGQFKELGQSRIEKVQGFYAVFVPATWEKNKLDLKVVFDKQGRVAGFFAEAPR